MIDLKTTMIVGAATSLLFAGAALAQNVQGRPGTAPGHMPGQGSTTAPGQLNKNSAATPSTPGASGPGASAFAPGRAQGNLTPGNPSTTASGPKR